MKSPILRDIIVDGDTSPPPTTPSDSEQLKHRCYKPLTDHQADELQKKYGKNVVVHKKTSSWFSLLIRAIFHPFTLILLALAIISIITRDYPSAITMSIMVCSYSYSYMGDPIIWFENLMGLWEWCLGCGECDDKVCARTEIGNCNGDVNEHDRKLGEGYPSRR